MRTYVILAQSPNTAAALKAVARCLDPDGVHPKPAWARSVDEASGGIDTYESLAREIELAAGYHEGGFAPRDVVVLVDSVRAASLSAVAEGGGWDALIAMLILTFPDMNWVFSTCSLGLAGSPEKYKGLDWLVEQHSLATLFSKARQDGLFDPTGLRNWVRARSNDSLAKTDDLRVPLRPDAAAAIDEESAYAYWHAFVAYRFGYRAEAVTNWRQMQARFGRASQPGGVSPHGYKLLLEDMSLNFADKVGRVSLLRLSDRAVECERLDSSNPEVEISDVRALITTGQARPGDAALAENRTYLSAKAHGKGRIVFKPTSGLFDLWEKCGLFVRFPQSRRRGNAEGFCWPPDPPRTATNARGHGAPGKLLLISQRLTRRAESLISNARTIENAVLGAVLTTDALELTGSRTPTAAIDALSLKHQFEVLAECQFSGVEYHLSIGQRIKEISLEAETISQWFHRSRRTNAKLNAEMTILHALVRILRNYSQFDEEQTCMSRIRYLHNTLWMRQSGPRRVLWPLLRYLELLLSSFAVFVTVIVLWVIGLSVLFNQIANYPHWQAGVADTFSTFFAVSGPMPMPDSIDPKDKGWHSPAQWHYALASCIAIFGGFIHGGVFISHLYSISSRR